jgi:tetratricopeptide (TPR) repeat protein
MNTLPSYIRVAHHKSKKHSTGYLDYAQLFLSKINKYPKEKEYSMASACIYFLRGGDFEKCIDYAHKFYPKLTLQDCKDDVLKSWASCLKKLGNWQELIHLQLTHLKADGTGCFTYLDLANSYEKTGNESNIIYYLEMAVKAGEANGADIEKLSELCWARGEMEKAGKYYGIAAAAATTPRWHLWHKAATAYLTADNEYEALYYLKVAVMINPTNAEINYQIGLIYQHRNDVNRAKYYYTEALKLSPGFVTALDSIAVLETYTPQYEKNILAFSPSLMHQH